MTELVSQIHNVILESEREEEHDNHGKHKENLRDNTPKKRIGQILPDNFSGTRRPRQDNIGHPEQQGRVPKRREKSIDKDLH